MKCRKAFGDMRLQATQGFRVLFGIEKIRDGLERDRLAQSGSRGLLIDGYARHRGDLNLARAVRESIEQQHAGEDDDCRNRKQCGVTDYSCQLAHKSVPEVRELVSSSLSGGSARSKPPGPNSLLPREERERDQAPQFSCFERPYFALARSMASPISLYASSAPPHRNTFTHFPRSRSL